MKRIFKYRLEIEDKQTIEMPAGAQILCVQTQSEGVKLWALVDDQAAPAPRTILIYGTGNPGPGDDVRYIGTAQMAKGALVWHVFEATK
jgi:hypothetical protein